MPYGSLIGASHAARHLWYSRNDEPEPLAGPDEFGPLWTDNSRLDQRIAGQQLLAMIQDTLSDRDRLVLEMRLQDMTLADIAETLGVTRERVRQIEAKLIRTIRTWCRRNPRHGFTVPPIGQAVATTFA